MILECRNREYVGKKLLEVPLYHKDTGNWDDKETTELKITKKEATLSTEPKKS